MALIDIEQPMTLIDIEQPMALIDIGQPMALIDIEQPMTLIIPAPFTYHVLVANVCWSLTCLISFIWLTVQPIYQLSIDLYNS